MTSSIDYTPDAAPKSGSISIPLSGGAKWIIGTALISLMLIYLIGLDEGATSVFGKTMVLHEFVHDARHLLGFPCH